MYCFERFSGNTMGKHLQSCKTRQGYFKELLKDSDGDDDDDKNRTKKYTNVNVFLFKIFSPFQPEFWLFIELGDNCTLLDLDSFLRDTWLECCGHLSSFTINNQTYEYQIEEQARDSKSMRIKLNKVIQEGMYFEYIYDYGSSTELTIKIISATKSIIKKGEKLIRISARNDEIQYECQKCKKEIATDICTVCFYEKGRIQSSFCNKCILNHNCGEEMALPIVNSPRSGVCGYTGES